MKRRENIPYTKMKAESMMFALLLTFTSSLSTVMAQNDIMNVMKNGNIVGKYNVNKEVDSIIFYQPQIQPVNFFTDIRDDNVYKTVTIGKQVWMAENLKYLPRVVGPGTGSKTTSYYYVYGYRGTSVTEAKATSNYTTYGVLYNWSAAMYGAATSTTNPSGVQGVCPTGWHLPSNAEWTQLIDYLAGESVAGGKLKEIGTSHWWSPNTGATNETGFTALPGGSRNYDGLFYSIGIGNHWWSATEDGVDFAMNLFLWYEESSAHKSSNNKEVGFSIRCVEN